MKLKIANYPIKQISIDSVEYPQQLKQLHDPPKQLYYRGQWAPELFEKTLAIVGSRRITSYGERVLDRLIPNLVAEGVTIISGFMYGTDTLAHQKTLECGGKTIAVLGNGLNVLYPPENEGMYHVILNSFQDPNEMPKQVFDRELAQTEPVRHDITTGRISSNGLILSEYPPEQQPQLWTFPHRNRIVAALSTLGILVIEAGEKSGSLVTAKIAQKLKKPLFAVPGPITSSVSRGTNQLIASGQAKMVVTSSDIVGVQFIEPVSQNGNTGAIYCDPTEQEIINLLSLEPLTLDEIALKLNRNIIELGQTLTMMSLRGKISEDNGKYQNNF